VSSPETDTDRLAVAIDAVVPADDFPSATQAGGLRFWARLTGSERPEWADRVTQVLDLLDSGRAAVRLPRCRSPRGRT